MSKVYKPKTKRRLRKHGFLVRMRSRTSARTIKRRRRKGRMQLAVQ